MRPNPALNLAPFGIDAHLLAATTLTEGARLWTRDKRLDSLAHELELAYLNAEAVEKHGPSAHAA